MTHPEELLSAFLDDELTPDERTLVATHLDECADCRSELAMVEVARSAVRSLPLLEPPPGLIPGIGVPRRSFSLRRAWVWATSGAVAVALAVVVAVAPGAPAPAFDLDTVADQHTARVVVEPGFATVRAPVGDR